MNCPICNQTIYSTSSITVSGAIHKYNCNCLYQKNQLGPTFICFTSSINDVVKFYLSAPTLLLEYDRGPGWIIWTDYKVPIASGQEMLTPEEGYNLFRRYQKLLVFL